MEKDILELENQKVQKQLTINYLTEQNAQFYETKGGFVGLKIGNEDYGHVNLIRTFPFSAPSL